MIVVDTSVLIDHLRRDSRARSLLGGAFRSRRRVAASVLTKVEVLAGVRLGEETATHRLLSLLDWVQVDEFLPDRAGDLAHRFLRSHPGVDVVDFVIAATVERLNADLWTRNGRHFPMFPELRDPYTIGHHD
ncbi:MAG: type II toxin-antitoxin system VapC family toxin [Chloroflexota bacterium]|nr:MAG: VapC toxin family PIN domain ribonuclease [Chloroflexota bacterium]